MDDYENSQRIALDMLIDNLEVLDECCIIKDGNDIHVKSLVSEEWTTIQLDSDSFAKNVEKLSTALYRN